MEATTTVTTSTQSGSLAMSRRGFCATVGAAGLAALAGLVPSAEQLPGGRLLGTVDFAGGPGDRRAPLDTLLGDGAGARRFTDVSTLEPGATTIPNRRFFVRTALPANVMPGFEIRVTGLLRTPTVLEPHTWERLVQPCGEHLLECSGNNNPLNFGLIGSARWEGIPLESLLDLVSPRPSTRVLVAGGPSSDAETSASWVFSLDEIRRGGAFLATTMNGADLPREHGAPVRLIVPGWYGCACVKWVTRIELVPDDVPATPHMLAYAARTHQDGRPQLARDFAPAAIDQSAMPIRVEKWVVDGRIVYRVVGIQWGGSMPTNALVIRFRHDEPFVPVDDCPMPATTATWSLWSHVWRLGAPGRYAIALKVADPRIRTRRLDLFFYTREIVIDEV